MNAPLRILHLEDDVNDAEIIRGVLEAGGIECRVDRVEARDDFLAALEAGGFDLILADFSLPSFDGLSALQLTLERRPDVPFIFVSGTLGEEVAIEAVKIGAMDYVLKERLSRIVSSVHRALREAGERAERKQAEQQLRRSEAFLAEGQRISHTGSWAMGAVERQGDLVGGAVPIARVRAGPRGAVRRAVPDRGPSGGSTGRPADPRGSDAREAGLLDRVSRRAAGWIRETPVQRGSSASDRRGRRRRIPRHDHRRDRARAGGGRAARAPGTA